jgi:hypothetical protein
MAAGQILQQPAAKLDQAKLPPSLQAADQPGTASPLNRAVGFVE